MSKTTLEELKELILDQTKSINSKLDKLENKVDENHEEILSELQDISKVVSYKEQAKNLGTVSK